MKRLSIVIGMAASMLGPITGATGATFKYQGFNLIAFSKGDFAHSPLLDQSFDYIVSEGSNFINVDWVVAFNDDGSIVAQSDAASREPPIDDILNVVAVAHNRGLKVFLKPHISFPATFENRMHYNTDLTRFALPTFFRDWNAYLLKLGMRANGANVDGIVIATEFTGFDANSCTEWAALIANLRGVFAGKIAYDALFNIKSTLANVDRVCFWDLVDIIGLSLYVPLSNNDNASLSELNAAWRNNPFGDIVDVITYLQSLSGKHNKPVMAMEGGYQSIQGGLVDVGPVGTIRSVDNAVQAAGLASYLETLGANQGEWLLGVSIWSVFPPYFDPAQQQSEWGYRQGYMTNGKPAAATIKHYFSAGNFYSPAVEYFHKGFGHYFITAAADEIIKLDAGAFAGWARTGESFNVYATPHTGAAPVCRFFTVAFPPSSSHFYAPRGFGCEGTLTNNDWQFEGDVFHASIPAANGDCPIGTSPIYRLYNNGKGGAPNHRFTSNSAISVQMLNSGYIAEGSGVGVGMCSPQ